MTRVTVGLAFAALVALGIGEVSAASFQCSQRYFTAHDQCLKRNNRELCDRVIGDRKDACLKTGCWNTGRTNKCGYSRL